MLLKINEAGCTESGLLGGLCVSLRYKTRNMSHGTCYCNLSQPRMTYPALSCQGVRASAVRCAALSSIYTHHPYLQDDVRRLCDVGASKKSAKAGYIGQKGIGFKSVFKVSWSKFEYKCSNVHTPAVGLLPYVVLHSKHKDCSH